MAPLALHRTLFVQVMAGYANLMGDLFIPSLDFPLLGFMAVKTFIVV
jgi:hypothetical protein